MAIRARVVKISATLTSGGTSQIGFGFIVGERNDEVVIVTANHVVRGDDPGSEDKSPMVTFFFKQGEAVRGSLQSTSLPHDRGDLAVIIAPKPKGMTLPSAQIASTPPARGQPVWLIGRAGDWDVPVTPGIISGVEFNGMIKVQGLSARVGSSGGPLVSAEGIIGMIIIDSDLVTEATPISAIQSQVAGQWQYSWQLVAAIGRPVAPPTGTSPTSDGSLLIWRVGSPHTGAVPDSSVTPGLASAANKLGTKLRVHAMSAREFVDSVSGMGSGAEEPDILAIDNHGLIEGIQTPLGSFPPLPDVVKSRLLVVTEALKESQGSQRGWEYLVTGSANYANARRLALRSPSCKESWQLTSLTPDLSWIVPTVAANFLRNATADLLKASDDKRLRTTAPERPTFEVAEIRPCGYWGTEYLAFVPLMISYESTTAIGDRTILLIFRKDGREWKLLSASADPISTDEFLIAVAKLAGLLGRGLTPSQSLLPAQLIAPKDGLVPQPTSGERFGNFVWKPSSSSDIIAEVAEFGYRGDARLFLKIRDPNGGENSVVSAGSLWTTNTTWKWRVWSISRASGVVFSDEHTFPN
jgi:hypothetical protein